MDNVKVESSKEALGLIDLIEHIEKNTEIDTELKTKFSTEAYKELEKLLTRFIGG